MATSPNHWAQQLKLVAEIAGPLMGICVAVYMCLRRRRARIRINQDPQIAVAGEAIPVALAAIEVAGEAIPVAIEAIEVAREAIPLAIEEIEVAVEAVN